MRLPFHYPAQPFQIIVAKHVITAEHVVTHAVDSSLLCHHSIMTRCYTLYYTPTAHDKMLHTYTTTAHDKMLRTHTLPQHMTRCCTLYYTPTAHGHHGVPLLQLSDIFQSPLFKVSVSIVVLSQLLLIGFHKETADFGTAHGSFCFIIIRPVRTQRDKNQL